MAKINPDQNGNNLQVILFRTRSRMLADGIFSIVGNCLLLLVFLFMLVKCITVAFTSPFSFDGGMNVQVAQNLIRDFNYSTSYGDSVQFDNVVQTGSPVLIPVAIFFLIFGESFAAGLMVNAIYLLLLVLALIYYLKRCIHQENFIALLSLLFLLALPRLFDLGFGLYGEIPMLFFFLEMLIFLSKYEEKSKARFLVVAGAFYGLAYLTKTVILIAVPAILFVSIYDFIFIHRSTFKNFLIKESFFLLGFLIPVVLFEAFKYISLGHLAYVSWWKAAISEIIQQAGVSQVFADTTGIFNKILIHLSILAKDLSIPVAGIVTLLSLVLVFFFLIVFVGVFKSRKMRQVESWVFSNHFLVLIIVALSYFGWWLLISSTSRAYYRRILVGSILLEICLLCFTSLLFSHLRRLSKGVKKPVNTVIQTGILVISTFLAVVALFGIILTKNHAISFSDTIRKEYTLAAGEYIKNLPPEAQIFGYGWWQAPNVAFNSGRVFENIYSHPEPSSGEYAAGVYLVVDEYASAIAPQEKREILRKYEYRSVFSRPSVEIYQLISKAPVENLEFSLDDKQLVFNKSIDFKIIGGPPVFTWNVFMQEKNQYGKWAQKVSGYLLKYDGEGKLRFVFVAPEMEKYESLPAELDIFINKELVKTYVISESGVHRVDVPLNDIHDSTVEITLSCSTKITPELTSRELAIFMVKMELLK